MEHGTLTIIAKQSGVTPACISAITRGARKPSAALAKTLETITGISRLSWLYPDEFPNPMIRSSAKQGGEHGTAAN